MLELCIQQLDGRLDSRSGMSGSGPVTAEAARRRRRRSIGKAKAKPAPVGLLGWIRTPQFGRGLFVMMSLLAATYVWQTWRAVTMASESLGPIALGMREDQVRAALGPAGPTSGGTDELLFDQDGRQFTVILDKPGRQVVAVSCREQVITVPACPTLLGVRIGDERAEVQRALGLGRLHIAGQREQLAYPHLGAAIYLQEGRVVQIGLRAGPGRDQLWQIVLRQLVR